VERLAFDIERVDFGLAAGTTTLRCLRRAQLDGIPGRIGEQVSADPPTERLRRSCQYGSTHIRGVKGWTRPVKEYFYYRDINVLAHMWID
jgi:hypothetical protein